MSSTEVDIYVFHRPFAEESIEARHTGFVEKMRHIGPPLGFEGLPLPPIPDFGRELVACYGVKYPIRGLRLFGTYAYPYKPPIPDHASYDDNITIRFKTSNKALNYAEILHEHFPKVIEAYGGYRAIVSYGYHAMHYAGGIERKNPIYNRLLEDPSIDVNGRNNIFTLRPAAYWDRLLCTRALGYGPEEVVARLSGLVPQVRMLNDGVYTVFNDDKDLSFEDFVAFNDRFKPILGLI